MAYLLRDGVAIYYEVHGSGPAILLTHGWAATGRMWSDQIDLLKKDFSVILWDIRGHGRSDSPTDPGAYSQAVTLADMTAILDTLGAAKAIVGGHSLGGYLSQAFYAQHKERVAALLLSGCGPGYRKAAPREAWNAMANRNGDELERRGLEYLRNLGAELDPSDHRTVAGVINAARHILIQTDASVIDSLPSIAVPTFIAIGAKDEHFLAGSQYLEEKIAGSRRHIFQGSGHAPNCEFPEEFNAALGGFLEEYRDNIEW